MTPRASTERPFFLGIDWGTSSFRGWLMDKSGAPLASVSGPYGIRQIEASAYADVLARTMRELGISPGSVPVVMCGMIGSAQGWCDAGYLGQRAGVAELADGAVRAPCLTDTVWIVPGVRSCSLDQNNDVMRGEETPLAGVLADGDTGDAFFCLPGTHSKWVYAENRQIASLSTYMTGEMFDLFRRQSVLSPLIDENEDISPYSPGFTAGLELSHAPQGLLHQLFAVRAGILTGRFTAGSAGSLLSGLVIGSETASMKPALMRANAPVRLVSDSHMAGFYQQAFNFFDISAESVDSEQACQRGLSEIAKAMHEKGRLVP